jgi:hypothetical protein
VGAGDKALGVELRRHAFGRLRPRLRGALSRTLALEFLPCLAQCGAPARARAQLLGQLIAARLAIQLILAAVRLRRLGQDLARDPLIAAIGGARGVRVDLRAVDRDHPDPHQPRPPAQPQDRGEELRQRGLVAATKLGDRRVVGHAVRADHAVGDVLPALALDPP